MCPDKQIISAFRDKELGEKWQLKVAKHIATCEKCRDVLSNYQSIHKILSEDKEPDYKQAMLRVGNRLNSYLEKHRKSNYIPFWKRSVNLPMPLALAALFTIIVLCSGLFFLLGRSNGQMMTITKDLNNPMEVTVQAPIEDLNTLLKMLEDKNFRQEEVISLPEDSEYYIIGEPQILRASEDESETDK
jgi:hypothetical protein